MIRILSGLLLLACQFVYFSQPVLAQPATQEPPRKNIPPATTAPAAKPAVPATERWEAEIKKLEADAANWPKSEQRWLFTGSSTVRLWKLTESFPDQPVINHGFGGSQMSDVLQYFDRIVLPVKPTLLVLYSGDNDLASNKTPAQVAEVTEQLLMRISRELPTTKVILLAVKPSPKRANLREQQQVTNQLLAELIAKQEPSRFQFLDLGKLLLDEQGQPKTEYYVKDQLHLSAAGYALWNQGLLAALKKAPGTMTK